MIQSLDCFAVFKTSGTMELGSSSLGSTIRRQAHSHLSLFQAPYIKKNLSGAIQDILSTLEHRRMS